MHYKLYMICHVMLFRFTQKRPGIEIAAGHQTMSGTNVLTSARICIWSENALLPDIVNLPCLFACRICQMFRSHSISKILRFFNSICPKNVR